ncbi:MAG TPA: hypothetical protein VK427_23555, partial [Kofleriaceae bacterium]|nr:hypothetical protein [Kofleriaceae bacterium]
MTGGLQTTGAALGPDEVLVWTGACTLARITREGARARVTLPFSPLARAIEHDAIHAVDGYGTIHTFDVSGEARGTTPLLEAPGELAAAAVAGQRLAVLVDGEVVVFERGLWLPWEFRHRAGEGYREVGVGLSPDGRYLATHYRTVSPTGTALGDNSEGIVVSEADGTTVYRHFAPTLPAVEVIVATAGYIAR